MTPVRRDPAGFPVRRVLTMLARVHAAMKPVWAALLARLYRARFQSRGRNFSFGARSVYSFETISVGDNVNLGYRPVLVAT